MTKSKSYLSKISHFWNELDKPEKIFCLITFALCLGFFILEIINGRNQFYDFQVYYGASLDFIAGNSPYDDYYGVTSGYYKYSPFVLMLFATISWIPFSVASGLFYFFIVFASIFLLLKIYHYLRKRVIFQAHDQEVFWKHIPLYLSTFLVIAHLVRELHLGNVNILLLLLFAYIFWLKEQKLSLIAGILLALGILVKPHFIILIPLFVLKSEWKTLGFAVISGVVFLALPSLIHGWKINELMHMEWLETMSSHNQSLIESPNTLYGLYNNGLEIFGMTGSNSIVIVTLSFIALCIFLLVLNNKYLNQKDSSGLKNYLEYFLLISLIPSLTHTDTEHFLWTLPILCLCIFLLIQKLEQFKRIIGIIILLIIAIPWYLNSPDIIGKENAIWMDKGGWIGISNLLIILITLFLFYKKDSKSTT